MSESINSLSGLHVLSDTTITANKGYEFFCGAKNYSENDLSKMIISAGYTS